ncbi:MAG TPA: PD-(D/E)XK nuclease family protein [Bacteroidales bacterium]|nr:PD-(D/E)XK nuclease family protein [Bacteroidales bacterium]
MKFLERTARHLVETYGADLPAVCIVLPSRRGGLFLKKYLGKLAGKATWAPEIFAVEDFILRLSGMTLCDNTRLLFELFEVYRSVEKEKAGPFSEFIGWGQQLIQDFNDVDSYLVDPAHLFRYLSESKSMAVWNPEGNPLTDFEKNYLDFFASLQQYHAQLGKRLRAAGMGYPGLIYRTAAGYIEEQAGSLPWKKIVFAGLNAMTAAEERIADVLISAGKAEWLWDADEYYLENPQQEAGDFLRRWKRKWPGKDFRWTDRSFADLPKTISVTGVPYHVGQAKYCGSLIGKCLENKIAPEEIAVILLDEQLLMPLLNSLPAGISSLNITMGYPLKLTPLFGFLDAIFRMHENTERFSAARTGGRSRFYFRDVFTLLSHPWIRWITMDRSQGNQFVLDELVSSLKSSGRIFISGDEISIGVGGLFSGGTGFLQEVFHPWNGIPDALECLQKVLGFLRDALTTRNPGSGEEERNRDRMFLEYVYAFSLVLNRLSTLAAQYGSIGDIRTFHALFARMAESESLPFYGEPLKGMQVMGMLESRTLDFHTVILLSANEDLLPTGKTASSFIPYDIRRTFRLPTYHQRNSVYGYHFYRMIQRAEQVYILYNTEPDELGGGEMSRFVRQVSMELPGYNPAVRYRESLLSSAPVPHPEPVEITVPKTGEVLNLLMEKARQGIGPTPLNRYRQCPLAFYFQDLLGIQEPEDLEEAMDPRTMGQVVHGALHRLYEPALSGSLDPKTLRSWLPLADAAVDEAFGDIVKGRDLTYGKNLLLVKVARIMVRKFLESEISRAESLAGERVKWTVKFLERPLSSHRTVNHGEQALEVHLRGFPDRIDKEGRRWVIIDYKTGKADRNELKIADWDDLVSDPSLDKSFQLLTYAWLLKEQLNLEEEETILPAIISLRRISEGRITVEVPGGSSAGEIRPEDLGEFEKMLMKILEELFDLSTPFSQTADPERCRNCSLAILCGR